MLHLTTDVAHGFFQNLIPCRNIEPFSYLHFPKSLEAISFEVGDPEIATNAASKVCERISSNQIITFLREEKRLKDHQSGNKKLHST